LTLRSQDTPVAVDLYGYGKVGRALLPILKRSGLRLLAARDSHGVRFFSTNSRGRRVLVDATSPAYAGAAAENWIRTIEETLVSGTPVVTCNKAPLALAWTRIARAAEKGRTTVCCSGTVGGGTPYLLLLRRLQLTHGIRSIRASLSGTLEYICRRIAAGTPLGKAVESARRAGWTEPDPGIDLDGTDIRAKSVIVHNALFARGPILTLSPTRPRIDWTAPWVARLAAARQSFSIEARITPGRIRLGVVPQAGRAQADSPVASSKVEATLADGSTVLLAGPGAGPTLTAGALAGDLLTLREAGASNRIGVWP
jgi:homoserine dehydrogenase